MDQRSMQSSRDTELVNESRCGNSLACTKLYNNYRGTLRQLIHELHYIELHYITDELINDVFVEAFEELGFFYKFESFYEYLVWVVSNTHIDDQFRTSVELEYYILEDVLCDESDPLCKLMVSQLIEKLNESMKLLPPDDRLLITKYYLDPSSSEYTLQEYNLINPYTQVLIDAILNKLKLNLDR